MDLSLIAIVTFVLLAISFATIRFGTPQIRKFSRQRLEKALTKPHNVHAQRLSIYDVFWDLGATDKALDFMLEHNILPITTRQKRNAFRELNALIKKHGSYNQFIESSLIDIEEPPHINEPAFESANIISIYDIYAAHYERQIQQNGTLPTPRRSKRTITAEIHTPKNIAYPVFNTVEPLKPNENYLLNHTLQDRQRFRTTAESDVDILTLPHYLFTNTCPEITDATQFDGLDTDAILRILFTGTLSTDLQKWSLTPRLQDLKTQLDGSFEDFYEVYQDIKRDCYAMPHNDIIIDLRQFSDAWTRTAEPMTALLHQQPWAGQPYATATEILIKEARENVFKLSNHAESNSSNIIDALHHLTHYSQDHLAGYVLYINRHKVYGKNMNYEVFEDDIESIVYFIQTELRKTFQKQTPQPNTSSSTDKKPTLLQFNR